MVSLCRRWIKGVLFPPALAVSIFFWVAGQASVCVAAEGSPAVTSYALAAPRAAEATVANLAAYLASPSMSPIDRAWSIFVWIGDRIHYDVDAYLSGNVRDEAVTAEDVLKKRVTVCDGFAALYAALARAAGLEVQIVHGYAKAYGVKTHEVFEKSNHAWILLKLDGKWHTVDPTWGAGFVRDDAYTKQRDTVYFYGQPEELQFTHWPVDASARSTMGLGMAKHEFEAQPRVDPGLFRAGIRGGAIKAAIAEPGHTGLVTVYEQNHRGLKAHSIPLGEKLKAGHTYRIAIEAPAFESVGVMHDGGMQNLAKRGDHFEGTVTPPPGSLLISGRPKEGGRLSGLFQYTVE
jgi:hypothetical protein